MVRESSFLYPERRNQCFRDAAAVIGRFLEGRDRKHFAVLCLDTKNQPVAVNIASVGDLNTTIVHPREVFKVAILSNAATVILGHNHPSGVVTPSPQDLEVTDRLREAGRILGIEVLDHVIPGHDGVQASLREQTDWRCDGRRNR